MGPPTRSSCSPKPSESSEQEINLFLKVSKTVAFNVKKSETVKSLKAMLCKKEGVSEYFPELFFSGERLKDDYKLVDCGVQKNSTLHLILQNSGIIKLFICIPSMTKTSEVEAKVSDTIQNIKSLIQVREGIHTDRFTLFRAGILLEDFRTLDSLGIKGESTLHLIFDPKDDVSISVKLATGGIVKVKVKLLYTVHDVKAIVGSIAGVEVDDQNLIYSGKQLEDSKTLAFYKIIEESVLEMVFADIRIFVEHHINGKIISVDVCQRDTVTDAKNKIFRKLGIPVDSDFEYLTFAGKQLEGGRDLASYGIEKSCTLSVCIRALKVFISIPSMKKTLEFEANVFYTIQKIKASIRVREGIEADHYIFHYDGILLEHDSSSFASLGINKTEATLVVTAKPKLGIHSVYVETATGMIVKTKVSSLYTVGLVKSLVGSIAGVPVGDHTLIYEGVPLRDWRIFGSYNIKETSVAKMRMTASQNPNASFSWNISIFVKPWSGKTITLYVGRYDTVGAVKKKTFGKLGIPCSGLHYLSFCGKVLDDGKNLATYGINNDNTIHVNCRFSPC